MAEKNVILVIGSVKAAKYQMMRRRLLEQGVKPQIVRVTSLRDCIPSLVKNAVSGNGPDIGEALRIKCGVMGAQRFLRDYPTNWLQWLARIDEAQVATVLISPPGSVSSEGENFKRYRYMVGRFLNETAPALRRANSDVRIYWSTFDHVQEWTL